MTSKKNKIKTGGRVQAREPSAPFSFAMEKELEAVARSSGEKRIGCNHKRDGEAAEAAFLSRATKLGFEVAKPWGDSSQFDFIVWNGSRCWRVQVKSCGDRKRRGYNIKPRGKRGFYTKADIDFLVVYIVPLNAWYVVPIEAVCNRTVLYFEPRRGSRSRKMDVYREAWCLMACPRDGMCNPAISVWRRCLAREGGECPLRPASPHGSQELRELVQSAQQVK